MSNTCGVFLAGVGGQGVILASRLLAAAALASGCDVKVSEVHGMAQRGGSVVAQVRFGDKVYSPLIPRGGADILLALEKLEALRFLPYLKRDGTVIINDWEIMPVPVLTGSASYPTRIVEAIKEAVPRTRLVPAQRAAENAGSPRGANAVLVGFLSGYLPFSEEVWEEAIKRVVPDRLLEATRKAFGAGRSLFGEVS